MLCGIVEWKGCVILIEEVERGKGKSVAVNQIERKGSVNVVEEVERMVKGRVLL